MTAVKHDSQKLPSIHTRNIISYVPMKQRIFHLIISAILIIAPPVFAIGVTGNMTIKADNFELDGEKNIVTAQCNLKVLQKDLTLTGNLAQYSRQTQVITITGKVSVTRPNFVMTCKELMADGRDNRITAKGEVLIKFQDIRAKSQNALYNIDKQEIVLTGSPKSWQGKDELSGNQITINLNTKKVVTKGQTTLTFSLDRIRGKND